MTTFITIPSVTYAEANHVHNCTPTTRNIMNEFKQTLELERIARLTTKSALRKAAIEHMANVRPAPVKCRRQSFAVGNMPLRGAAESLVHLELSQAAVARYTALFTSADLPRYLVEETEVEIFLPLRDCVAMLTLWLEHTPEQDSPYDYR